MQDAEPQRLLGRQVDEPALVACLAGTLHRRVVSDQHRAPFDSGDAQTERTRERHFDQLIRVVRQETRDVGQHPWDLGPYAASASARPIGRLPQRLAVAKSSSRSR